MTGPTSNVDVFERLRGYDVPPPPDFADVTSPEVLERYGISGRPLSRALAGTVFAASGLRSFARMPDVDRERVLRAADSRRYDHPLALVATLTLRDDPLHRTLRSRATSLVVAAASLAVEVRSGRYEQIRRPSGAPEEMGQYPNLFGTGLHFVGPETEFRRTSSPSSLAVACRGRLFLVEFGPLSTWSAARIDDALGRILDDDTPGNQPFGLVSATSEHVRGPLIDRIRSESAGVRVLDRLEEALFTLCLHPDDDGGTPSELFASVHGRVNVDRWFGSSLQFVVHRDGGAAAIANFRAWLDGNAMIRGVGDISRGARSVPTISAPDRSASAAIDELRAELPESIAERAAIDVAGHLRAWSRPLADMPWGEADLRAEGVAAVDSFTIAVALAVRRRVGTVPMIGQAVSASGFACGELQFAQVPASEFGAAIDALTDPYRPIEERAAAVREAAIAHRQALRQVRSVVQIDALRRIRDASRTQQWPRRLEDLGLRLLRGLRWFDPTTPSVLLSHPTIDEEFTALGRPGALMPWCRHYALHYRIGDRTTQVALAGGPELSESDDEVWSDLERALADVVAAVDGLRP